MKFIADYKEFGGNPHKSVIDYVSPISIDKKELILRYL